MLPHSSLPQLALARRGGRARPTPLAAALLGVGALLSLGLGACRKTTPTGLDLVPPAAYAPYVAAFTSGLTSAYDPIQVQFATNVPGAEPGAAPKDRLLVFAPAIAGELRWANRSTLVFTPDQPLAHRAAYTATLHLQRVLPEVPDSLAYMQFGFQTLGQGLAVRELRLHPDDVSGERSRLRLEGTLASFDRAPAEQVEAALTAMQGSRALPVAWEHDRDQRRHRFVVAEVTRTRTRSEPVTLRWGGGPLGIAFDSTRTVSVPALDSFVVTSIDLAQAGDQRVELTFSDPVDPTQDLRGLVGITDDPDAAVSARGNVVVVEPAARLDGDREVFALAGIRSAYGDPLRAPHRATVAFRDLVPAVAFIGDGVIVPASAGALLPFKAVGLAAVDVTVVQVFSPNVGQFFQDNDLASAYALRRVGRRVFRGEIPLRATDAVDLQAWNNYTLDLSKLVAVDPGAIYRVTIDFTQAQAHYPCGGAGAPVSGGAVAGAPTDAETALPYEVRFADYDPVVDYYADYVGEEGSYYDDGYYDDGYYDDDGRQRPSPCEPEYYRGHARSRNLLASDFGLIAKRSGSGELLVFATDLTTAAPLAGLTVELHDYQQQVIAAASTGGNGVATFADASRGYLVVARRDRARGYLRLAAGDQLPTSAFEVAGEETVNGVRGFLYAERGVWRPGDSIYVTLAVAESVAPAALGLDRNVRFEFVDTRGRVLQQRIVAPAAPGMYDFRVATEPDAPTGVYTVRANYHGATTEKSLRVETVMPNRLKVAFELPPDPVPVTGETTFGMQAHWLQGAPAGALRAELEFSADETAPVFARASETQKYREYDFVDDARRLSLARQTIFEGTLDASGRARFTLPLGGAGAAPAPGMLRGRLVARVFEPTGPASTVTRAMTLSPYPVYIGARLPAAESYYGYDAARAIPIQLVALAPEGTPATTREVDVEVYNVEWSYWWERDRGRDYASYVANRGTALAYETTLRIEGGRATWNADLAKLPFGRKLVRFVDRAGGHATAVLLTLQDPRWAYDPASRPGGAEILAFNLDKGDYTVGETARVALPAFPGARALVSVERGDRVLSYRWVEGTDSPQDFALEVTPEMAPNAYVSVSLIQPHARTANDQPIRLYGVQALTVTDPASRLRPTIAITAAGDPSGRELAPEADFAVSVAEADGRAMSYTLDVVEEGLLDLTSYTTPDPYARFNERLGLAVRTFDLYRHVLGAFTGKLAGVLGVGGDAAISEKVDPRANRFKPVVRHLGPYYLAPGATARHTLRMPNYIGSVRVSVVAAQGMAFGSAEETRPVRRPLMVVATLPRVVSPGETIELPVTVFATEPGIGRVDLALEGLERLEPETRRASVSFAAPGERVARFRLRVPETLGVARLRVTASGGGYRASDAIELEIRAPNPRTTEVIAAVVEPGETWAGTYAPVGVVGTNAGALEVSATLPLNLEARLAYLVDYPYGCLEQVISQAFPQLYLADLTKLSPARARATQANVEAAIARLPSFRRPDGSLAYWPGERYLTNWGTTYAGHFLLEAEAKGYRVPADLRAGWLRYQRQAANAWRPAMAEARPDDSELIQAYRLLTLALAREPQFGAMNRMRAGGALDLTSLQLLAASYAAAGQPAVAREVLAKAPRAPAVDRDAGYRAYTYGSPLRDEAIQLYVYTLLGDRPAAFRTAQSVSRAIASDTWYSTQTTAWSLLAMSAYQGDEPPGAPLTYAYRLGAGTEANVSESADLHVVRLDAPGQRQPIRVRNTGQRKLYVRIAASGIAPTETTAPATASGLRLDVAYVDAATGRAVDPETLPQGRDLRAVVTVANASGARALTNLALTQLFPSGWEIRNRRLEGETAAPGLEYQDIRDDRVLSFFSLAPGGSVTVTTEVNATYVGTYGLPQVYAEAMYDRDIRARSAGGRVRVVGREPEVQ